METEAVDNTGHSECPRSAETICRHLDNCTSSDTVRPLADQTRATVENEASGDAEAPQNDSVSMEELPQYESVVGQVDCTDGGRTQVQYENLSVVNKDVEAARESVLITEAPPTYRQLFGEQRTNVLRRKFTRNRQSGDQSIFQKFKERLENNKLAATFVVSGTVLLMLSLPMAMIIIGGLNVGVCSSHEIPLYLLIAGFILVGEVIFQTSICIATKHNSHNETVYRTLRMCDCLVLFLFIWLLVGTYWIFMISLARGSCGGRMNDIVSVNTTVVTGSEGGTQISVLTPSSTQPPGRGCSDCDSYVYSFTAFAIMFQYIAVLVLLIFCCSSYFRKYGR